MNHRLGQHFLKNKGKIKEIIDALELKRGDFVIEIGAGHGELTEELLKKPGVKVMAVEKDGRLVKKLKENFKFLISNFETNSNDQDLKLTVIEGDALKILLSLVKNFKSEIKISSYKITGNIPYYITGKLLRTIGELITNYKLPITVVVLTVQKEVAERMAAKPPRMNLLAASVQFWASPEIIGFISKKDFKPQPKVDSAIIRLKTKQVAGHKSLAINYYKLIRVLFKQPRKTILNNLSAGLDISLGISKKRLTEKFEYLGIDPFNRPQNLGLNEIFKIVKLLKTEKIR